MTNGLIGTAGVISERVDVPMGPSVEWLFASALRFIFPMRIAVGSPLNSLRGKLARSVHALPSALAVTTTRSFKMCTATRALSLSMGFGAVVEMRKHSVPCWKWVLCVSLLLTDVNARRPAAVDHVAEITLFSSFRIEFLELASGFPGARPGNGTGGAGRVAGGVVIMRIPWMHLTEHPVDGGGFAPPLMHRRVGV